MNANKTIRGYKDIGARLAQVWGVEVSLTSVQRWCSAGEDPIPVRRIKSIVIADADKLDEWAKRQIR